MEKDSGKGVPTGGVKAKAQHTWLERGREGARELQPCVPPEGEKQRELNNQLIVQRSSHFFLYMTLNS